MIEDVKYTGSHCQCPIIPGSLWQLYQIYYHKEPGRPFIINHRPHVSGWIYWCVDIPLPRERFVVTQPFRRYYQITKEVILFIEENLQKENNYHAQEGPRPCVQWSFYWVCNGVLTDQSICSAWPGAIKEIGPREHPTHPVKTRPEAGPLSPDDRGTQKHLKGNKNLSK